MDALGGNALESASQLSDTALVAEVTRMSRAHRALTAELVAHLAEMDARKLYRSEATPSMFVYCMRQLGFSEDEACRRIDAARIARKWPVIFEKLVSGELSLSVVGKLKPFLTDENVVELAEAVSRKSVREAERILAARFPKPDVADSIRKLPDAKPTAASTTVAMPTQATLIPTSTSSAITGTTATSGSEGAPISRVPEEKHAQRPADRGKMQPLSEDRIQVKFTASRALEAKLELARDLMSHRNPRGDLAAIVEAGVDLLIAELLKKKLGQTRRRQKKARTAKRTHVTNQTRREVVERDGLGCTFVNANGERCGARAFLELDHRDPKGKGGDSDAANVRLLCRAHNQLEAERVYGKSFMDRKRGRKEKLTVRDGARRSRRFIIGFERPRRRGYSSSAGRTTPSPVSADPLL